MTINPPCVILGCGFLGIPLARQLFDRGFRVIIVDRNLPPFPISHRLSWISLDISVSPDSLLDIIPRSSIVFHLLSTTVPADVSVSFADEYHANISLSESIIRVCIALQVTKLIFASSASVYGESTSHSIQYESSPLQPISVHGLQKSTIEQLLYFYHFHSGIPISILRISNPYGTFDKPSSRQGIIGILLSNYKYKKETTIYGLECIRDYIYIDDLIDSFILIATSPSAPLFINVSSSIGISTDSLLQSLQSFLPSKLFISIRPRRPTDIRTSILSNSLLNQFIDVSNFHTIHDGLERTVASFFQSPNT